MKVFLSWSGDLSKRVATELREWIPLVLQNIDPYMSEEDLDKGTRWSLGIAKELEECNFGVLCVTSDNQHAPWVMFEAGALSRSIDKSRVVPFLFNMKKSEVTNSPLVQFQMATYEEEEVKKIVWSLNSALDQSAFPDEDFEP